MSTLNAPHMAPNLAIPALTRPEKLGDWGTPAVVWLPMEVWQDGNTPLSKVLLHFGPGVQQLNFVGGWDAAHTPPRSWWDEPARTEGIRMSRVTRDPAGARYTIGAHHIDVRMSATWYGECADVDAIRRAHHQLGGLIAGAFPHGSHLWGTPGRTGLDLFERSLPAGATYHAPPVKLEAVIRHNIGQGRMEFCAPDGLTTADELISLDARWMYAACIKDLPRGPVTHLEGAAARRQGFMKYKHAFYRVVFRVPEQWPFVGLLPAWHADAERTYYPRRNTGPASWYEAIVAEPELRLALDNAWEVRICESWYFNFWGEQIPDPARNWIEKLRNVRARQSNELIAGALRNIANHTVGQWHRTAQRQLNITPAHAKHLIPAEALDVAPVPNLANVEQWEWYAPARLDPAQLKYQHPEWSAYVWCRARYRVALAALTYQRECGGDVIAFRNDAIVVTRDPHWRDDGAVGTFREKRRWLRGLALPDGTVWDGSVPRDELHYRQLLGSEDTADE